MIIEFSPFRQSTSTDASDGDARLTLLPFEAAEAFLSVSALEVSRPAHGEGDDPAAAVVCLAGGMESLTLMRCGKERRKRSGEPTVVQPAADHATSLQNFLLLVPEPDDILLDEPKLDLRITEAARGLLRDGFVYVAWSFQRSVEDDDAGVRYLSLRERLPSFGTLTSVIVVNDERWIDIAAAGYPSAHIFLLGLKTSPATRTTH